MGTYTLRETVPGDVDAVHALTTADRIHYTGTSRVPRTRTDNLMQPPDGGFSYVVERDGEIVQWWNAVHSQGADEFYGMVTSQVGLEDLETLFAAGWAAGRAWATAVLPDGVTGTLRTGRVIEDTEGRARLERNGFTPTHTFWAMAGDVPDTPAPQRYSSPEGLVLEAGADQRQVHDVLQEGFAQHFGFSPQSFDESMTQMRGRPGYNPQGWYLAALDGRAAAAMVLSWESESRDALMVLELATLEWARGRGVATALLHQAFDVARAEGLHHVELFVDSENDTGAPALYRSVGLEVVQAMPQFECRLVPGVAQP